jgi:hypothetical protein
MQRLNHVALQAVLDGFSKRAFVPMPGGQAEPVAGASMMTAGQVAPMGGDPAAGGMPMDPAAMGGMPMDPAAMGGMPMDPAAMGGMPMDPAAMGGMPTDPSAMGIGGSSITMTIPEFIQLIEVIRGGSPGAQDGAKPKKPKSDAAAPAAEDPMTALNAKLDQVLSAVGGGAMPAPPMDMAAMGGGAMPAPPMGPAAMGAAPAGAPPMPM